LWCPSSDGSASDKGGSPPASTVRLVALLRGHRFRPAGSAFRQSRALCLVASGGSRAQSRGSLLPKPRVRSLSGSCRRTPNRPCVAWSPDRKGLGPEGTEGTKLEGTDACACLGGQRASRRALRTDGSLRPGPVSGAGRALCPLGAGRVSASRGGSLLLSRRVVSRSARPNRSWGHVFADVARGWKWALCPQKVTRAGVQGGRSLLRPNSCSEPLPPLGRHTFGRGSEPPKNQGPSGFRGSSAALARPDRDLPSGGCREVQDRSSGLPDTVGEKQVRERFAPP
jgi:hypothetical protein